MKAVNQGQETGEKKEKDGRKLQILKQV